MNLIDWKNFAKELRIHFAEEEQIKMNPVVEAGLKYWNEMNVNKNGTTYASFESRLDMNNNPVVRVKVGTIHSNGFYEIPFKTRVYFTSEFGLEFYDDVAKS